MKNNELTFDERMKRLEIIWFKPMPQIAPKPRKRKLCQRARLSR